MNLSRRNFIKKGGAALLLLGISGPLGWWEWGNNRAGATPVDNILVVVQLSGGNDGLNTVVPYGYGAYYDNRPTLAIAQQEVLPLDSKLGFHPALIGLKKLFDDGKVAVINGVGYPNPNRSHFRSMDIWQTAAPDRTDVVTGWLGRYLDLLQDGGQNPLAGVSVGAPSKVFLAKKRDAPAIENPQNFQLAFRRERPLERTHRLNAFRGMYSDQALHSQDLLLPISKGRTALQASDQLVQRLAKTAPGTGYPEGSSFGKHLQLIGQMIGAGLGSKTYFTQLGGFDDHSHEKDAHARVLKELDGGVSSFYQDLKQRGMADRVTILIYSEFGRRVKENASQGTDHGTAAPVLMIGGQVKGGLHGELPSLTSLDNGDLKYNVDFRSVYGTLLEQVLTTPSQDVLGGHFERIRFL